MHSACVQLFSELIWMSTGNDNSAFGTEEQHESCQLTESLRLQPGLARPELLCTDPINFEPDNTESLSTRLEDFSAFGQAGVVLPRPALADRQFGTSASDVRMEPEVTDSSLVKKSSG